MKNLLSQYLDKRLTEKKPVFSSTKNSGPVITISREVGCNGLKLARSLANSLNSQGSLRTWKVLSKEIFYESARELNLDYNRITRYFKSTDRYTFEEILYAFSNKNYKSERKIIKTVVDVIHSFAVEGHCIIVGRAGHIIAKDINNALHLRLVAPVEYRIKTIMENNKLDRAQAIGFIQKVEKERGAFRKALKEETMHENEFNLIINRGSFSTDEAINIIMSAVEEKKLLEDVREQIFLF